jgi:tetratricopeptide (TPR) repeat protein
MIKKRWLCAVILLNACGHQPTLQDIPHDTPPMQKMAAPTANIQLQPQQRIDLYQQALVDSQAQLKSGEVAALQMRLAQLQLQHGEAQLDTNSETVSLQRSIELAQAWLDGAKATENTVEMLYLLAKAQAMQGQHQAAMQTLTQLTQRYPKHAYSFESHFRLAEDFYSRGEYQQALTHYQRVVDFNPTTQAVQTTQAEQTTPALSVNTQSTNALSINALYMSGWCLYKLNQYQQALTPFDQVLSTPGKQPQDLRADTLRMMAVIASAQQGTQTLKQFYGDKNQQASKKQASQKQAALPIHVSDVYLALADYYRQDERWFDAANVYRDFQQQYPAAMQAYQFQVQLIELLEQQKQFADARQEKQVYVKRYAHNTHADNRKFLSAYLLVLAQYHHHQGQAALNTFSSIASTPSTSSGAGYGAPVAEHATPVAELVEAITYYQQWLKLFPQDIRVAEQQYLLAQAYFETQQYPQAISLYAPLASTSAPAAKALLATYSRWLGSAAFHQLPLTQQSEWQEKALLHAQSFYQLEASAKLTQQALILKADGLYQQKQFAQADQAYRQLLQKFATAKDSARWRQQLAICLYQQAKPLAEVKQWQAAIDLLLQIPLLTTDVALAKSAQLDAATYQMQLMQWDMAAALLKKIRMNYPETSEAVAVKLAFIYTQQANPLATADELMQLAQSKNPQQQTSLLQAAKIYAQQQKTQQAITAYQQYVQTYTEPLDETISALQQLIALNQDNPSQQDRWRREIIRVDDQAKVPTQLSRQQAAAASLTLSTQIFEQFIKQPLTLPLEASFPRKQQFMQQAIDATQQVLAYDDVNVQAAATDQMAEIFHQFSRSLLQSPKPTDLDALALDEYNLLLEEQAAPFEDQAIQWHERNVKRLHQGQWNEAIAHSLQMLQTLVPAKYRRPERGATHAQNDHH